MLTTAPTLPRSPLILISFSPPPSSSMSLAIHHIPAYMSPHPHLHTSTHLPHCLKPMCSNTHLHPPKHKHKHCHTLSYPRGPAQRATCSWPRPPAPALQGPPRSCHTLLPRHHASEYPANTTPSASARRGRRQGMMTAQKLPSSCPFDVSLRHSDTLPRTLTTSQKRLPLTPRTHPALSHV